MAEVALGVLVVVIVGLLVERFLSARDWAVERRQLIAAVLAENPAEYRLFAAETPKPEKDPVKRERPVEQIGV